MDLRSSIVNSCNVFYYQSGLRVGPEAMARYARAFGLGAPPAWTWPARSRASCRRPRWKRQRPGRRGQAGETINIAIGQGQVLVTPMQVARMMAAVANGGVLWKPRHRPARGGPRTERSLYSEPTR